jgi:cytochrome c-type biogenesis protein
MDLTLASIGLAFVAGLASVLSPCVLPVLPIVLTGGERDSRWRPVAIVAGLSSTFVLMGVLTSLFGGVIAGRFAYVEKGAGLLILAFGLLMLADVNPFKQLSWLSRLETGAERGGLLGALVLGATLGLVWVPCVGPMLSSVLALVASKGQLLPGLLLLLIYSLGFALPMLAVAGSSQWLRVRLGSLVRAPAVLRMASGGVLSLFGVYVLWNGLLVL